MLSKSRLTRADEESRCLALINSLVELEHEFQVLDLPSDSRDMLQTLLETCRRDFRGRFSR
jgi:hypothetical protein